MYNLFVMAESVNAPGDTPGTGFAMIVMLLILAGGFLLAMRVRAEDSEGEDK